MKRRTLFKNATVALLTGLGQALPRRARAQDVTLERDERAWLDAIAEAVLPGSLTPASRANAVAAFAYWLEDYQPGVPMSYGYGNDLKYAVVPPSPLGQYRKQFEHLQAASRAKGASFMTLSLDDRRAVLAATILEAGVTELPDRPTGQHVATDFLGHFYGSSNGNDFLFNAYIRRSGCRGLDDSAERPAPIV